MDRCVRFWTAVDNFGFSDSQHPDIKGQKKEGKEKIHTEGSIVTEELTTMHFWCFQSDWRGFILYQSIQVGVVKNVARSLNVLLPSNFLVVYLISLLCCDKGRVRSGELPSSDLLRRLSWAVLL